MVTPRFLIGYDLNKKLFGFQWVVHSTGYPFGSGTVEFTLKGWHRTKDGAIDEATRNIQYLSDWYVAMAKTDAGEVVEIPWSPLLTKS